jgi:hypothetical protein
VGEAKVIRNESDHLVDDDAPRAVVTNPTRALVATQAGSNGIDERSVIIGDEITAQQQRCRV